MSGVFANNCYAVTWSSNELIEKARELDGRKLSYKGEIVTAILYKGEYSWVNLNDGVNAIGVWCKTPSLNDVKFSGDYKHTGDILQATGVFHRSCKEHSGELDIHADTIKIVRHGSPVNRPVDAGRIQASAILFLVLILTVTIFAKRL